jgi:hypothetical protein
VDPPLDTPFTATLPLFATGLLGLGLARLAQEEESYTLMPMQMRVAQGVWRGGAMVATILALILSSLASGALARSGLPDQQIVARIIQESRSAYYATGRPCACPDDHARNGSLCGGRSAYSRPGGYEPKCYTSDVTPAEIEEYRISH